jgi:hypothetical protein
MQMAAGCKKRRYQVKVIERRIGELLGGNSRSAGLFNIQVGKDVDGIASVIWSKKEDWRKWSQLSEGCSILRNDKKIRLRCSGTPTKPQLTLLQHLKLNLPIRLTKELSPCAERRVSVRIGEK